MIVAKKPPSSYGRAMNIIGWYSLSLVHGIYTKNAINIAPQSPLYITFCQMAVSSTISLGAWRGGYVRVPRLKSFRPIIPITVYNIIGLCSGNISYGKSSVAFTNVVKSTEPVFNVMIGKDRYSLKIYISLLVIITGVACASITDARWSALAFFSAMCSNFGHVSRSLLAKEVMEIENIEPVNMFAIFTITSTLVLGAIIVLFYRHTIVFDKKLIAPVVVSSIGYHFNSFFANSFLQAENKLSYSVANTIKKIFMVAVFLKMSSITLINGVSILISFVGVGLYQCLV